MWTHPCAYTCTHACTADSLTDWQGACLGTHTFRDIHRRRLWEVESESSDQSCGWCFCPDFRCSTLHFKQGNVWGMAHPGLQLKGQCDGPFLASAPSLHLLSNWSQPSCVSSGLFLPLTLPSAPLTNSPQVGWSRPTGALTS